MNIHPIQSNQSHGITHNESYARYMEATRQTREEHNERMKEAMAHAFAEMFGSFDN